MSYLVIARKYRPQKFEDVVGQSHITKTLQNAIKNNRLGQAYLFSGTRGVGKTTTARILAKTLNCKEPVNFNPCDKCDSCLGITNSTNVDVYEINGADRRKIEDVRSLIEAVKYRPMLHKYKIYIIDEVHMLTKDSFNALLKTLEEPPEYIIFIFATTELHQVPETILSRCQLFQFRRISIEEIKKSLCEILNTENIKYEENAIYEIAKLGNGSLRDAQSLLDKIISFNNNNITLNDVQNILGLTPIELFEKLTNHIIDNNYDSAFSIIRNIINKGLDLGQFLKDYIIFFRNLLLVKNIKKNEKLFSTEYYKILSVIKNKLTSNQILILTKMLIDLHKEIKYSNYVDVLFELMIFNMIELLKIKTEPEIPVQYSKPKITIKKEPVPDKQEPQKKNLKKVDRIDEISIIKKTLLDFGEQKGSGIVFKNIIIKLVTENKIVLKTNSNAFYKKLNDEFLKQELAEKIFEATNKEREIEIIKELEIDEKEKNGFEEKDLPIIKETLDIFGGKLISVEKI